MEVLKGVTGEDGRRQPSAAGAALHAGKGLETGVSGHTKDLLHLVLLSPHTPCSTPMPSPSLLRLGSEFIFPLKAKTMLFLLKPWERLISSACMGNFSLMINR